MGNCLVKHNEELEKAIQGRKAKYVKQWLLRGADGNSYSKKSNYSFLSMAITLREEILVKYLLQHGADPDQISWLTSESSKNKNYDNEYPIHIAATHGSFEVVETLLNFGADVNIGQGHKLGTALHQASKFGHYQIVKLLLMRDADIIAADSRMNIPLHLAATYGQAKSAQMLLDNGSPVNICNAKNWTPLHYAAFEGASNMVGLLLQNGADPNITDSMGKTPIDVGKNDAVFQAFLSSLDDMKDDMFQNNGREEMKDKINRNAILKQTLSFQNSTASKRVVPPKPARRFTSCKTPSSKKTLVIHHDKETISVTHNTGDAAAMTEKLSADNPTFKRRNRTHSLPARNKMKMTLQDLADKQERLCDSHKGRKQKSKKLLRQKSADALKSIHEFKDSKYTENPPAFSRELVLSNPIVHNRTVTNENYSAENNQGNSATVTNKSTDPTINTIHIDHTKKLCQDLRRLSNSLSNIKDMLFMSSLDIQSDRKHNNTFLRLRRPQSERTCTRKSKHRHSYFLEKTQSAGNRTVS